MAHFAELNENNIVQRVLVVDNKDILDENGQEQESIGVAFLQRLFGENTIWKQCSYNNNFRNKYTGKGDTYREDLDAFISPSPYPSWSLNETTFQWEPPTPRPEDIITETTITSYVWNEDTLSWDENVEEIVQE
jgi:hypothetical protein